MNLFHEASGRGELVPRGLFKSGFSAAFPLSEAVGRANAMAEELQKADEYLRKHRILELFSVRASEPSSGFIR